MTLKFLWVLYLSVFFLFSPNVFAGNVVVSGFGTVAYSYENEEDIGFLRDLSHQSDINDDGQWLSDSRLGLQFDYLMDEDWRFTTQVVAKDNASDRLSDAFTLGFVAYRPTSDLEIRTGRLGLDAFWATTTRNIDYGHNWVRPPQEVYGWIAMQALDGVDFLFSIYTPDSEWYLGAQYGAVQSSYASVQGESISSKGRETLGLSVKYLTGSWRARAAVLRIGSFDVDVTAEAQQLRTVLNTTSQVGGAVGAEAEKYSQLMTIEGEEFYYSQLGLEYFTGKWLLASEFVSIASESNNPALPSGIGGYLNISYYWDSWTPYSILAMFHPDIDALTPEASWSAFGLDTVQSTAISGLNSTRVEQDTISVGIRWDVMKNIALKAQADFISIAENGYGLWVSDTSLHQSKTSLQLYTLSLNFIF
ncbi:hypothetical protein L4C33_06405 [Vibrio makurazakiensis]|uniref:hypothetical protein n=1 Tax=Vibrio makurazakiensis TaxID=2910250 RepID=UPI003D142386